MRAILAYYILETSLVPRPTPDTIYSDIIYGHVVDVTFELPNLALVQVHYGNAIFWATNPDSNMNIPYGMLVCISCRAGCSARGIPGPFQPFVIS